LISFSLDNLGIPPFKFMGVLSRNKVNTSIHSSGHQSYPKPFPPRMKHKLRLENHSSHLLKLLPQISQLDHNTWLFSHRSIKLDTITPGTILPATFFFARVILFPLPTKHEKINFTRYRKPVPTSISPLFPPPLLLLSDIHNKILTAPHLSTDKYTMRDPILPNAAVPLVRFCRGGSIHDWSRLPSCVSVWSISHGTAAPRVQVRNKP